MKYQTLIAMGTLLLAAACGGKPSELDIYVAQIRRDGMPSESKGSLMMIALINSGQTILTYPEYEPGHFGSSYQSPTCVKPNATPEEKKRIQDGLDELERKTSEEFARLKPLADADGSGFITTKEASDFRTTVEVGYKVSHFLEQRGDLEEAMKVYDDPEDVIREYIRNYNSLVERGLTGIKRAPLKKLPL